MTRVSMSSGSQADIGARLRAEAAFQARRTLGTHKEPRDKYYFLADRAMQSYRAALGDVDGKRVLVVGCAEGGVTPLARRGATVVGIDISEPAIVRLREAIAREGLSHRATAFVMNAENPDLPGRSFDLVCCTGVLHHLDVEAACRSWSGILRPGGELVMLEPMAWNPGLMLYRLLTPGSRTADEHPLRPKDVAVLKQHFAVVDVDAFVLTSVLAAGWAFLPSLPAPRRAMVRALECLDDGLLAAMPWLRYAAWTAVIRCRGPRAIVASGQSRTTMQLFGKNRKWAATPNPSS